MKRYFLPDRWLDYRPYGSPIEGTRIMPIKTPLSKEFHVSESNPDGVPEDQQFTPPQFVKELKSQGLEVSLVINLCNTNRYYHPKTFEKLGVQYVKLDCPGQVIPSDSLYELFAGKVKQSLDNLKGLVVVHCTHGINRTGYLICRYLMQSLGFTCEDALQAFGQARLYEVERKDYIEHLRKGCPPIIEPADVKPRSEYEVKSWGNRSWQPHSDVSREKERGERTMSSMHKSARYPPAPCEEAVCEPLASKRRRYNNAEELQHNPKKSKASKSWSTKKRNF